MPVAAVLCQPMPSPTVEARKAPAPAEACNEELQCSKGVMKVHVHCMKLPSLQQLRPVQVSSGQNPLKAC